MGALADALEGVRERGGPPSAWPEMVRVLPPDAVDDILAALLDDSVGLAQLKRAVEKVYPDAPIRSTGTWRNWRLQHRAGRLV